MCIICLKIIGNLQVNCHAEQEKGGWGHNFQIILSCKHSVDFQRGKIMVHEHFWQLHILQLFPASWGITFPSRDS